MTYQQILTDLKQKKFQPVYFLCGKEAFFIDAISAYIENHALAESERAFNQVVLYGRDVDHVAVIDHARRYPMMASHQVVIVKEAQDMKDLRELIKYVEKPTPTTILVLCHKHKAFNKNTKFAKLLKAKAVLFDSKKLYDNQVPDWIMGQLRQAKLKVGPNTAALLAEYLGTDLSLISHELEKLALHLPPGTEVTPQHVEEHIGISREYNIFELQNAIASHNLNKVARITKNFIANPKRNPFIMVTASLGGFFTKVYQLHFVKNKSDFEVQKALNLRSTYGLRNYRAALRHYPFSKTKEIIALLKEYDLKAKGVNFNTVGKEDGALLKELMWKILH
ncbi:MAG TPA: DNA polymerase III subunit delta [Bacteroidetes bacterium]|nr:DNA polymerase III subunit delta [Bacteroidota bacterium]